LLHWSHGKFFRHTMKNGLPSDSIVQVLGDTQGNLWLGTRAGIVRILAAALARFERGELNELPVSVYGQPDGLLTIGSAIIYQPNSWRGVDGTLFFAMANSVAEVKPGQIHINPLPPTVALEEMWADDKHVWPARAGAILTTSETAGTVSRPVTVPTIKVGPGRGDLEFHYTGLSLGAPLRVRFKYKLEGLESTWNNAGGERKAIYRHVPPGKYIFRVIACNSDGVCSQESDLMTVQIEPHFYQTILFRGGIVLLAVTGLSLTVALAMRQRMRRRLEQLERQHELERERSRIARDLHDDLGAGLTEIGLLGGLLQYPSRYSTRKQEALQRIVQRCHDLVVALDEIVWAVNPQNDSVKSLASYLCRYAQGFLEPTAICCRLKLPETEPDHPLNSEQRHNLFLAFKEALTNVVRHSGATEVRIKISFEETSRLLICIEDNGRGLPAAGKPLADADGLNNLRQRMKQIGGQCEIANQSTGGLAVRLSLSLVAHL
jgi:signal transduction histidine kinase